MDSHPNGFTCIVSVAILAQAVRLHRRALHFQMVRTYAKLVDLPVYVFGWSASSASVNNRRKASEHTIACVFVLKQCVEESQEQNPQHRLWTDDLHSFPLQPGNKSAKVNPFDDGFVLWHIDAVLKVDPGISVEAAEAVGPLRSFNKLKPAKLAEIQAHPSFRGLQVGASPLMKLPAALIDVILAGAQTICTPRAYATFSKVNVDAIAPAAIAPQQPAPQVQTRQDWYDRGPEFLHLEDHPK